MNQTEKIAGYKLLNLQLRALLSEQNYTLSNLSNAAALLWHFLPNQVYIGFYLYNGEQLILGPFQGSVSCVEIALGKGVCGEAAQTRQTVKVDDVKSYQNYIACDGAALSELVIPLMKQQKLVGVLDLDASRIGFYDAIDVQYLEEFAQILCEMTDFKFFELG